MNFINYFNVFHKIWWKGFILKSKSNGMAKHLFMKQKVVLYGKPCKWKNVTAGNS